VRGRAEEVSFEFREATCYSMSHHATTRFKYRNSSARQSRSMQTPMVWTCRESAS